MCLLLQLSVEGLEKGLSRPADTFKRLAQKTIETLHAVSSFPSKAVRFVAEHKWTLTVFVAGLIRVWLMQKCQKSEIG